MIYLHVVPSPWKTSWGIKKKKKKKIAGYSPSQKFAILTSSAFALCPALIFPGSRSQLLPLPFYLFDAADTFARHLLVCPDLLRFVTDRVDLVRYHYHNHQCFLIH